MTSLFAHVSYKSGQTEWHATEALAFILEKSKTAPVALTEFLHELGAKDVAAALQYVGQSYRKDAGIPDIIGFDYNGNEEERVIIEGKFGARLTAHQPVAYLERLSSDAPGVLLFVVPDYRVREIWEELAQCCKSEKGSDSLRLATASPFSAIYDGRHVLAITSWRRLLAALEKAADTAKDQVTTDHIYHLQELCAMMDRQTLEPFQDSDLDATHGQSLRKLGGLVEKVMAHANHEGWTLGRQNWGPGWFGQSILDIQGVDSWFGVAGKLWSEGSDGCEKNPLWLEIYSAQKRRTWRDRLLREDFEVLLSEESENDYEDGLAIAITVRTGVSEEEVVADVLTQLRRIANLLP